MSFLTNSDNPNLDSNLAGGVLGGITGAVGAQPTTTTGSSTTNSTTNQSQSGTGTTTKNLTPYQSLLQGPLSSTIMQLMTNPEQFVAPFAAQARDATNSTYAGLGDTLRQQFMGTTGGGQSGKFGQALASGNLQRLGALQGVDTTAAMTAATLPLTAAQLAEQFLGQNFGTTSTNTATGTSNTTGSTTSQQKTQQGNSLLGGIGGIASTLLSFL